MTEQRVYAPDALGPDGYPPEWHASIKHAVREEARNRCVRCSHPYVKGAGEWSPCDERCEHRSPMRIVWPNGDELHDLDSVDPDAYLPREIMAAYDGGTVQARWRILTVHHLDSDKANCRWWNLAALCQRCHLQVQGRVRMERVWPWPHSDWFKPYVAGFYAWSYLGEDLDRPSVEARLDELLSLELAVGAGS